MKFALAFFFTFISVVYLQKPTWAVNPTSEATDTSAEDERCTEIKGRGTDIPIEFIDMTTKCVDELKRQINMEVNASTSYLGLAAHFSRDTVNRPGFAKFFFEAASEEREHAMKLIEFLLTRGELNLVDNIIELQPVVIPDAMTSKDALKTALTMETDVTSSIRQVIAACDGDAHKNCHSNEGYNDYYLVDYLSGDFLEEQYHGQRDLAGKISTLLKMMNNKNNDELGEFLFDKKLLNGGLFK